MCFLTCYVSLSHAQVVYFADKTPKKFTGIGLYDNDSTFSMNVRFRMQSRLGFNFDDKLNYLSSEYFIRRLRLSFDGFVFSKKLTYKIQLSFSRGDMDWDNTGFPNIIRDAVINYKPTKHLTLAMGQTKLPGNRERVVSSSELQFPDRSTANARFNLDRDFGLFFTDEVPVGKKAMIIFKGAMSTGKGRNIGINREGFAYTGRVELLPLGKFELNGDYTEGDWIRESKPKFSLGASYHLNQKALRTGGVLGTLLYQPRDIKQSFLDAMVKYQGWAFLGEYMTRTTNGSPVTTSTADSKKTITVFNGSGVNTQLSYQFKNHWEVAGRFTNIVPMGETKLSEPQQTDYALGVTKYLNYHRLKVQWEVVKTNRQDLINNIGLTPNWTARFQVELGI